MKEQSQIEAMRAAIRGDLERSRARRGESAAAERVLEPEQQPVEEAPEPEPAPQPEEQVVEEAPEPEPAPQPEPQAVAEAAEPEPSEEQRVEDEHRPGLLARLFKGR